VDLIITVASMNFYHYIIIGPLVALPLQYAICFEKPKDMEQLSNQFKVIIDKF